MMRVILTHDVPRKYASPLLPIHYGAWPGVAVFFGKCRVGVLTHHFVLGAHGGSVDPPYETRCKRTK
jgi:hypothetical protein